MARELSERESNLLSKIFKHNPVSKKMQDEVRDVWKNDSYSGQREYANILFLLLFFIAAYLTAIHYLGVQDPIFIKIKYFLTGAIWVLYFVMPIIFLSRTASRILRSNDKKDILCHTAVIMWYRVHRLMTIYDVCISIAVIVLLFIAGLEAWAILFALSFIVAILTVFNVARKVNNYFEVE